MLPIRDAEVGFFPASARIPHWATVHQAAERKAAEEAKKKAAEEKRKEAAKKKAAEEKKKEAAKKKKKEDEARRAVCIVEHRDRSTEGIANDAGFGYLGLGSDYSSAEACYPEGYRCTCSGTRVCVPRWQRQLSILQVGD